MVCFPSFFEQDQIDFVTSFGKVTSKFAVFSMVLGEGVRACAHVAWYHVEPLILNGDKVAHAVGPHAVGESELGVSRHALDPC